jgi:hypothetical protein
MSGLASARFSVTDDFGAAFTDMYERGFTDGLPVIPPTEPAARAMLEAARLQPDELIALVPPEGGPATAEKVAINAVMAGCLPEYFPVVVAAMRAITEPKFNLLGVQTTTNPVSPVLIINGPVRKRLNINSGRGCIGPGWRSNATIGRAIRLCMLNIGGCPPGDVDKAIHGMPGKLTFCFGEAEEASPWDPFHVENGFPRDKSTVTAVAGQGTQNIYAAFLDPVDVVTMVADAMACYGNNGYLRAQGNPLVIFSPGHANIFADAGWSKQRVKAELFERTKIPRGRIPRARQLSEPVYTHYADDQMCLLCPDAGSIIIIVAGGPEAYHVTYVPNFGTTLYSMKEIEVPG